MEDVDSKGLFLKLCEEKNKADKVDLYLLLHWGSKVKPPGPVHVWFNGWPAGGHELDQKEEYCFVHVSPYRFVGATYFWRWDVFFGRKDSDLKVYVRQDDQAPTAIAQTQNGSETKPVSGECSVTVSKTTN
jgi:hypothetical protein